MRKLKSRDIALIVPSLIAYTILQVNGELFSQPMAVGLATLIGLTMGWAFA